MEEKARLEYLINDTQKEVNRLDKKLYDVRKERASNMRRIRQLKYQLAKINT